MDWISLNPLSIQNPWSNLLQTRPPHTGYSSPAKVQAHALSRCLQSLGGPLYKQSGSSLHLDDVVLKYYLALVLADVVSTLSTNCHPPNVFCVVCISAQGKNSMSANLSAGISMRIRSRISGSISISILLEAVKVFETFCSYTGPLKMWNEIGVDWNSTVIALHDLCCLSTSV